MKKELLDIVFLFFLFVSCEEIYKPNLEDTAGMLVVDAHITNDPSQNFVKLFKTTDFNNSEAEERITGARVEMVRVSGNGLILNETIYASSERSPGNYIFQEKPLSGEKYKLRITVDSDIYESSLELMPPSPTIDSLYTSFKLERSYRTDVSGSPTQIEIPVREILIDAPITQTLHYYRFNWRTIIQWTYYPGSSTGPPPPSYFGWISRYQDGVFNLAAKKQFSISDHLFRHPILSLPYNNKDYLDSVEQTGCGWIIILDQYGISRASYDYHENLNKQLSAEGSLFDPLLAQVYGNIRCINDEAKIVLGYFDLNSHRQHRYFLDLGDYRNSKVIKHEIKDYPDIPDKGFVRGIPPEFWESN